MNWSIEELSVIDDGNLSNVVRLVRWRVGKDEHEMSATIKLDSPGTEFIPYESLDEQTVLSWIWGMLDKVEIERKLQEKVQGAVLRKAELPWKE